MQSFKAESTKHLKFYMQGRECLFPRRVTRLLLGDSEFSPECLGVCGQHSATWGPPSTSTPPGPQGPHCPVSLAGTGRVPEVWMKANPGLVPTTTRSLLCSPPACLGDMMTVFEAPEVRVVCHRRWPALTHPVVTLESRLKRILHQVCNSSARIGTAEVCFL